jgi:hypothetical protein
MEFLVLLKAAQDSADLLTTDGVGKSVYLLISGILTILLAAVGYFLSRIMKNMEDLNSSVVDLRISFEGERQRLQGMTENHIKLQTETSERLSIHGRKIDNHETRIAVLEHRKNTRQ